MFYLLLQVANELLLRGKLSLLLVCHLLELFVQVWLRRLLYGLFGLVLLHFDLALQALDELHDRVDFVVELFGRFLKAH